MTEPGQPDVPSGLHRARPPAGVGTTDQASFIVSAAKAGTDVDPVGGDHAAAQGDQAATGATLSYGPVLQVTDTPPLTPVGGPSALGGPDQAAVPPDAGAETLAAPVRPEAPPATATGDALTKKSVAGVAPPTPRGQPRTKRSDETEEGPPPYRVLPAEDGDDGAVDEANRHETQAARPAQAAARTARAVAEVVVPGYEVLEEVGRGGMGVVYKARQLKLNRLVALKMLLTGVHSGPEHLARFRAEAEAIARLEHPHIVHVYEVGEHKRKPFCALEFVGGGSLDKRLVGEPLSPRQAAALAETLARAMEAAHRGGIIHRDLKPANVLLVGGPELPLERCLPKITDFGLAKQLDEDSWKTRSGAIMGTPSYMAPEQAGGQADRTGPCTDVYALGAMLYEFLTGRPPFRAATMMDTLEQVRYQEPVPPSRLQPKVPRDLETICLKCLQKEPPKRYASAQGLADDLERFLQGQPILARPTGSMERLTKWAKRRPAVAALIVVSALALLSTGAGVVAYMQSRTQLLEQQLADRDRLDGIRRGARALIDRAKELMRANSWEEANRQLSQAEVMATTEAAGLPDLAEEIRPLMAEVQTRLREENARRRQNDTELAKQQERDKARRLYQQFLTHRDSALLHASMSVGDDVASHLRATEDSVRQALGLVGVQPVGVSLPRIPPGLDEADRSRLHQDCYELLLVLAEAVAQPRPGRPPEPAHAAAALRVLDHAARLIPETQAYHLRRARCYDLAGNKRAAEAAQRAADRLRPGLALDHYLVGEERYKQGDVEAASRAFQQALTLDPDAFWARYLLAVCYVRLNRAAEAREALTACCKDRPEFVWPYLMLGFVNGQLGELSAAEDAFTQAEKRAGADQDARCALYANRGLLRISEERVAEGLDDLRHAVAIRPRQYQVHLSLALIHEGRKEWATARLEFDRAIDSEPGIVSLYRARARFYVRRHDYQAALRDFATAIAKDTPNGAPADLARDHAWRGRILHRLQQYEQAVAAYDRALRFWPEYTDAYLWRGEAQLVLKRYQAAAASLDAYVARHRQPVAAAFRARALARTELGRYAAAVQDYSRALELEPVTAAAHVARGLADAGGPCTLFASADFAAALEVQRARAALHAARGWVYLAYQAPLLALPDFEAAVRMNPHGGDAYNGRGLARVKLGRHQPGAADADEALRQGPVTPGLCYDAARVFAQAVAAVPVNLDGTYRDRLAQERRGRYRERAFSLLRRALRLLPLAEAERFCRQRVQRDSALDPIRRDPRFARLIDSALPAAGPSPRNPEH
jgi:serine/threonine protein kinase/lipoprotein NlpI